MTKRKQDGAQIDLKKERVKAASNQRNKETEELHENMIENTAQWITNWCINAASNLKD